MSTQNPHPNQSDDTTNIHPNSASLITQFPHPPNSKPLLPVYRLIRLQLPPTQARDLLERIYTELTENIEAYWGPPDVWHNLSINASRMGEDEAEYYLWLAGLHAWPDDVDLLCDILAEYTGPGNQHHSPDLARKTWQILATLPREKTAPYWRFWAFGAVYFAQVERDPQRGLDLLDEGLLFVRRDGLVDILRNYRALLVDQIPRKRVNPHQLEEYQAESLALLESRYRLGIQLGIENGYTLATELAKLFQERAASRAAAPTSSFDPHTVQQLVSDDLEKALTYLTIAEALYTGDVRSGIEAIYSPRIRILMAQREFGEALLLLQALPEEIRSESSMATMLRLATLATGGQFDRPEIDLEHVRSELLANLFDGNGAELESMARTNRLVLETIVEVVRRFTQQSARDEKEIP